MRRSLRRRLSTALSVVASLCCLVGCTTTLDPTTWESSPSPETMDPDPVENPPPTDCSESEDASFLTCADLPPCSQLGEEGNHILCAHELSYDAASHECRLRGGHLAEVDSAGENALIAQAAEQTVGTNVWLGGRRSETFVWAWEHSQIVFWSGDRNGTPEENVFVAWEPGEPNNTSTVSDEPEKCLVLTLGDIDWNDRACSLELPFACEID